MTTYTSANTWQAAVEGSSTFTQSFQSVTKDTYFQAASVTFGPFALQQIGADSAYGYFENFIDVPPLQFTDNSGVTNAALYTKSGLVSVNMTFPSPIYAWGANFYDAQTGELENMTLLDAEGNTISTVPVTVNTGFFGFVLTPSEPIKTIVFQSQIANPDPTVGQGFGLESVMGACSTTCAQPTATFNPASVNFGNIGVGKVSAAVPVTVTNNTSTSASLLNSVDLKEFKFSPGNCTAVLAAGASCSFTVSFAPTAVGSASGTVTGNTSNGPVTFTVSGTGTGAVTFTPASVNFGSVTIGSKSSAVTVTIANNTASTATFASQSGLAEFQFTGGSCEANGVMRSLAAGASCTFVIDFAPTSLGVANGSFTGNTSAGPATFNASGTGIAAP